MDYVELVNILNAGQNLLKEAGALWLLDAPLRNNVVKQLPTTGILHDEVQLLRRLNYLV